MYSYIWWFHCIKVRQIFLPLFASDCILHRVTLIGPRPLFRILMITFEVFISVKEEKQEMTDAIMAGLQAGFLSPIVGREYQLSQAADSHRDIIESKGAKGKLVLIP